jgi:hypothetical protein
LARRPLAPQTADPPRESAETRVSDLVDPRTEEEELQLGFVLQRLMQAWTEAMIVQACRDRFGIGKTRTHNLIVRVRDGLKGSHDRNAYARVEQIGRLRSLLVELHAPRYHPTKTVPGRDAQGRPTEVPMRLPKNIFHIERVERLLAELEGNRVPERVDVHVTMTAAMGMVLGQMTDARLQEFVEAARERRRLALVASNGVAK